MPDTHLIAPFHLDQLAALTNGMRVEECAPRTSTMAQHDHKPPPAEGSTDKPSRPNHAPAAASTAEQQERQTAEGFPLSADEAANLRDLRTVGEEGKAKFVKWFGLAGAFMIAAESARKQAEGDEGFANIYRAVLTRELGKLTAATLVPAAAHPVHDQHPDRELLALGRDLETAWAAERVVTGNESATTEDIDAATAPGFAIARKILATPATTLEGLTVKARAILWCGHDEHEAGPRLFGADTIDRQLAGSIIADLIKAGAAGSTGDAALLEAWRGYVAGMRGVDAMDGASPEAADQFYAAHIEPHRDAIEQTPARTVAGFAVQLRYLFTKAVESLDGENTALFNDPITPELADELNGDFRWRMLWRMAEAATKAAAEAGHPLFPADAVPTMRPSPNAQPELAQPHPDAAILETFDRWRAACRELDASELDEEHPTIVALVKTIGDAEEFILSTPARSVAGMVVKLTMAALDEADSGADHHRRVVHGTPLPEDASHRDLWEAIDALREMVHTTPAQTQQADQPQDADPFGAAVAEFEQAAPSILPAVPSAVMVEAGAAAAGIDATTVRTLYAAMAQAHQRSAAA